MAKKNIDTKTFIQTYEDLKNNKISKEEGLKRIWYKSLHALKRRFEEEGLDASFLFPRKNWLVRIVVKCDYCWEKLVKPKKRVRSTNFCNKNHKNLYNIKNTIEKFFSIGNFKDIQEKIENKEEMKKELHKKMGITFPTFSSIYEDIKKQLKEKKSKITYKGYSIPKKYL